MKRNLVIILLVCITALSCKTPEAREPVTVNSGSFINESIARNKALYQKETKVIADIIAAQPENNYQTSGNGFWYYFNTEVTNDSLPTPTFGDIVKFNYNVKILMVMLFTQQQNLKIKTTLWTSKNYFLDYEKV